MKIYKVKTSNYTLYKAPRLTRLIASSLLGANRLQKRCLKELKRVQPSLKRKETQIFWAVNRVKYKTAIALKPPLS